MADNVLLNPGAGGATLATDDIGGVHHQRVKVQIGADGAASDVEAANPMPVAELLSSGADGFTGPGLALSTAGTQVDGTLREFRTDADGHQQIDVLSNPLSIVNAGNSSTATLGAGGTFTGTFVDTLPHSGIMVSVFASHDSATDGLKFQWSSDGTNVDVETSSEILANQGRAYPLSNRSRFFRVTYTNGATPQSAFRLQTILRSSPDDSLLRPIDKTIDDTYFAPLTRSVLAAKRNDGAYGNIRSTNGDNLKTSISEFDGVGTQDAGRVFVKNPAGTDMGSAAVPVRTDPTGTTTQPAQLVAGTALAGDVGISGARTSGGTTLYRNVDVDETEDEIKGTAGQVYWVHAMNLTASVLYLQFYNATAATVIVGTTTPDLTFPLATQGDTNGAGFTFAIPNGIAFGTAITIACTTTIAGAAGPALNGCVVNLGYA